MHWDVRSNDESSRRDHELWNWNKLLWHLVNAKETNRTLNVSCLTHTTCHTGCVLVSAGTPIKKTHWSARHVLRRTQICSEVYSNVWQIECQHYPARLVHSGQQSQFIPKLLHFMWGSGFSALYRVFNLRRCKHARSASWPDTSARGSFRRTRWQHRVKSLYNQFSSAYRRLHNALSLVCDKERGLWLPI